MKTSVKIDLKEKVAVITGAGGVICSCLASALAQCGAKVALLDLNETLATQVAEKITAEGGVAKAYKCNVLEKESLKKVHLQIVNDLGPCDILINGAGGNNPRATTDNEYHNLKQDLL